MPARGGTASPSSARGSRRGSPAPTGKSYRRMKNPTTPMTYMIRTSTSELAQAVDAERGEDQDRRRRAAARGIARSFTQRRMSGRFSTSSITLPMYRLAISAQTRSGEFCRTAAARAAGCRSGRRPAGSPPSPRWGCRASAAAPARPENAALLAASGPATPSIAPLPELAPVLRQPLLEPVGQEGRDLGAARPAARRSGSRAPCRAARASRTAPVVAVHAAASRGPGRSPSLSCRRRDAT